jgi:hypothetical protein
MADYPDDIFLRPPLFDGDIVRGGGLNAAVRRLSEIRAEVVAIETELGVEVGGASNLAERLDMRLAANGIPRGQPFFAGTGLWNGGTTWMQAGQVTLLGGTTNFPFITFTVPYLSADVPVAVFTQARSAHATDKCGRVLTGRILATGFFASAARRGAATSGNLVENLVVNWLAVGGTPA